MKLKVLLASLLMLSLIGLLPSLANADCGVGDTGVCDTVRVGCPFITPTVVVGDSFMVPIYIWNDEIIGGFTLGFKFDPTALEVVKKRFSYTGSVMTEVGIDEGVTKETLGPEFGAEPGQYLFGWTLFGESGDMIQASTTDKAQLLVTLKFYVKSGATPMHVAIDSAYYPPAGPFLLSTSAGGAVNPQYVHCANGDIMLPVQDIQVELLPARYELGQNSPNPFNPNTAITFAVPRPSQVRVEVFNVLGQKVKILANEFSAAGYKRVEWDGTDENGSSVASGVYLYRMTAGDFTDTKKMLLLK